MAADTSGSNTFSISVANGTCPNYCGVTVLDTPNGVARVDVEYTPGYEVLLAAGDGQTGATAGPLVT